MGSVVVAPGLQGTGSTLVAHRLSCSTACGTFPDQGSNWCHLHLQCRFLTTGPREPSVCTFTKSFYESLCHTLKLTWCYKSNIPQFFKKYVKLKFKKELAETAGITRTLEGHLTASRKAVLTPRPSKFHLLAPIWRKEAWLRKGVAALSVILRNQEQPKHLSIVKEIKQNIR